MRSEQEMFDLIMDTARQDDRIRAVIMTGSRTSPHARRDIFQDFDIAYLVDDVAPFKNNFEWIGRFGEIMIMQLPEEMEDPPPNNSGSCVYLMQFTDGNKIDLAVCPMTQLEELSQDSLSVLLLDKDGVIEPFAPPSERDYLPGLPTSKAFADCCSEFWWVSVYVAKELWRQEIIYARHMLDQWMRAQLMKMLTWHLGVEGRPCNPYKPGKYFQQYLEPELWDLLLKTYADAGYDAMWEALFVMGDLFRRVALPIAEQFGFAYPHDDDRRVTAHLEHVRRLPKDAKAIYG